MRIKVYHRTNLSAERKSFQIEFFLLVSAFLTVWAFSALKPKVGLIWKSFQIRLEFPQVLFDFCFAFENLHLLLPPCFSSLSLSSLEPNESAAISDQIASVRKRLQTELSQKKTMNPIWTKSSNQSAITQRGNSRFDLRPSAKSLGKLSRNQRMSRKNLIRTQGELHAKPPPFAFEKYVTDQPWSAFDCLDSIDFLNDLTRPDCSIPKIPSHERFEFAVKSLPTNPPSLAPAVLECKKPDPTRRYQISVYSVSEGDLSDPFARTTTATLTTNPRIGKLFLHWGRPWKLKRFKTEFTANAVQIWSKIILWIIRQRKTINLRWPFFFFFFCRC
jgi:hypothetical protein